MTSAAGVGLATITPRTGPSSTPGSRTGTGRVQPVGQHPLSVAEVPDDLAAAAGPDQARGVETIVVRTVIADLADKPLDTYDAYCGCTCCRTGWSSRTA